MQRDSLLPPTKNTQSFVCKTSASGSDSKVKDIILAVLSFLVTIPLGFIMFGGIVGEDLYGNPTTAEGSTHLLGSLIVICFIVLVPLMILKRSFPSTVFIQKIITYILIAAIILVIPLYIYFYSIYGSN